MTLYNKAHIQENLQVIQTAEAWVENCKNKEIFKPDTRHNETESSSQSELASDHQSVANLGEPAALGDQSSQVGPMNTTSTTANYDAMVNHAVPLNYSHDGLDNNHLIRQSAEGTVTTYFSQHNAMPDGRKRK